MTLYEEAAQILFEGLGKDRFIELADEMDVNLAEFWDVINTFGQNLIKEV